MFPPTAEMVVLFNSIASLPAPVEEEPTIEIEPPFGALMLMDPVLGQANTPNALVEALELAVVTSPESVTAVPVVAPALIVVANPPA